MTLFTCSGCSRFRALSRAAAKSASARLRRLGLRSVATDWADRATICERCPLRVIHRGVSYCGKPFLKQVHRDEATDGCGCPTREKAKSPSEHCPIDPRHQPAQELNGRCNCKWCAQTLAVSQITTR
jgi:hypothetical protein